MQTLSEQTLRTVATPGQPGWLERLRREALGRLGRLAPPARTDERWRFTDLDQLALEQYELVGPAELTASARHAVAAAARVRPEGVDPGAELVLVNGTLGTLAMSEATRRAGALIGSIDHVARDQPQLIQPRLGRLSGDDEFFTTRALALAQGGAFVHVPAGVELSEPLQVVHWFDAAGLALHPRTVIVVEPGARVVLSEVYISDDQRTSTLIAPTVELFVGQGARVSWLTWQAWGRGVRQVANLRARVERDATLQAAVVTTGGDLVRTDTRVELAGPGARSDLLGAYLPGAGEVVEHWTLQDHRAPRTTSDLRYLGALAAGGRAVYYGTIRVGREAGGTDAYQQNRNLLLSASARADTNPQLEIETSDVRCSHGATVGPIDRDQLFYLMSRGIPPRRAEQLVVQGFLGQVLGRLEPTGLVGRLKEAFDAKLAGA